LFLSCSSVRPCVRPETLLTRYLARYLTHFQQIYINDARWDSDERVIIWDQKVKGHGHGGIQYAGNSIFWFVDQAKAEGTSCVPYIFWQCLQRKKFMCKASLSTDLGVSNLIRLHHIPMVKTIVFVIIIIILFSSQMKFSGQTRNLYRYGPQVDLRTLTHFQ